MRAPRGRRAGDHRIRPRDGRASPAAILQYLLPAGVQAPHRRKCNDVDDTELEPPRPCWAALHHHDHGRHGPRGPVAGSAGVGARRADGADRDVGRPRGSRAGHGRAAPGGLGQDHSRRGGRQGPRRGGLRQPRQGSVHRRRHRRRRRLHAQDGHRLERPGVREPRRCQRRRANRRGADRCRLLLHGPDGARRPGRRAPRVRHVDHGGGRAGQRDRRDAVEVHGQPRLRLREAGRPLRRRLGQRHDDAVRQRREQGRLRRARRPI